jgi:hypothetical protein
MIKPVRKLNQQKIRKAISIWQEVHDRGRLKIKNGIFSPYRFPIFDAYGIHFPFSIHFDDGNVIDAFIAEIYKNVNKSWGANNIFSREYSPLDYEKDYILVYCEEEDILVTETFNEEKKFIKLIAQDNLYGKVSNYELDIQTIKGFIEMIVPNNWNVVTQEDELIRGGGTVNIELSHLKDGVIYGMPFPWYEPDMEGGIKGMWFCKNHKRINLIIMPTVLDWRVTVIHELAHIANLRYWIWKEGNHRGVIDSVMSKGDLYMSAEWFKDEEDNDHGEHFKKAMMTFKKRWERALSDNEKGLGHCERVEDCR